MASQPNCRNSHHYQKSDSLRDSHATLLQYEWQWAWQVGTNLLLQPARRSNQPEMLHTKCRFSIQPFWALEAPIKFRKPPSNPEGKNALWKCSVGKFKSGKRQIIEEDYPIVHILVAFPLSSFLDGKRQADECSLVGAPSNRKYCIVHHFWHLHGRRGTKHLFSRSLPSVFLGLLLSALFFSSGNIFPLSWSLK